ncbi:MAG TPA: flagellar biosynthesis protein FliO [Xanthobacteraceae bacterium]|nr:flagellar biosynthesis protein FliO [Xanthobacteraceae bacterium]
MLDSVFGTEMPLAVKFLVAFPAVLGLIGLVLWLVHRFGTGRLGGAGTRGRQPRLGVIDHASVDARRRLILVRRDNVEHLLMIGGPTDVVVEANIVRAVAAPRDVAVARPAAVEPLPRAIPLPDNGNGSWPLQPDVITPPPPARPAPKIEPATEEAPAWPLQPQSDTPPARPQRDTLAALADELSARPTPPPARVRTPAPARAPLEARAEPRVVEPRPEPRAPAVQPAPTPTPADTAAADQSLAEMAHRLEAALRKPNAPAEARAPAPQPRQESRQEPRQESRQEPRQEPRQAQPAEQAAAPEPAPPSPPQPRAVRPAVEPKPARSAPAAKPPQSTTLYDNLEQEMASLLGRPTNKS